MDTASYTVGDTHAPKHLLAQGKYTTRKIIVTSGQNLIAGSVIGAILLAAAATVTPGTPISGSGGTVGNGAVGTWTVDAGAMPGTWHLEITVAGASGKYKVVRPDGTIDGVGTVAVAYNGQLNGTLADGASDWAVGDLIPITVSYDSADLEYKLSAAASTDGSQAPDLILAQDVDASDGAVEGIAFDSGNFAGTALTLGSGHTVDSIREGLRLKGIIIDD